MVQNKLITLRGCHYGFFCAPRHKPSSPLFFYGRDSRPARYLSPAFPSQVLLEMRTKRGGIYLSEAKSINIVFIKEWRPAFYKNNICPRWEMIASRIVEGVLFQGSVRLHQQAFKHQATSLELPQVLNCLPYLAPTTPRERNEVARTSSRR